MLYYKVDNTIYANRKQLRDKIGINQYKREIKKGNIMYITEDFFKAATICGVSKNNVHNDYEDRQKLQDTCISK